MHRPATAVPPLLPFLLAALFFFLPPVAADDREERWLANPGGDWVFYRAGELGWDVIVARIVSVSADEATQGDPPRVVLEVNEVFLGDPALDRTHALWKPFPIPDSAYPDRRNEEFTAWSRLPMDKPRAGETFFIVGARLPDGRFGVPSAGRIPYAQERRAAAKMQIAAGIEQRKKAAAYAMRKTDDQRVARERWLSEAAAPTDVDGMLAQADFVAVGRYPGKRADDLIFVIDEVLAGARLAEGDGAFFAEVTFPPAAKDAFEPDRRYLIFAKARRWQVVLPGERPPGYDLLADGRGIVFGADALIADVREKLQRRPADPARDEQLRTECSAATLAWPISKALMVNGYRVSLPKPLEGECEILARGLERSMKELDRLSPADRELALTSPHIRFQLFNANSELVWRLALRSEGRVIRGGTPEPLDPADAGRFRDLAFAHLAEAEKFGEHNDLVPKPELASLRDDPRWKGTMLAKFEHEHRNMGPDSGKFHLANALLESTQEADPQRMKAILQAVEECTAAQRADLLETPAFAERLFEAHQVVACSAAAESATVVRRMPDGSSVPDLEERGRLRDFAFRHLEEAALIRPLDPELLLRNADFRPLHEDPRWNDFLEGQRR